MIGLLEIVISVIAVTVAIYFYNVSRHSLWKKQNVEGPKPIPIFGNFLDIVLARNSIHEKFWDLYETWKHKPFIGLYQGTNPILIVNDPELIKHILIKDFASFSDRGFIMNEKIDPLSANLFMLEGHRWKGLRSKLTPVFSSGKLKQMYHLLTECTDQFEKYIDDSLTTSNTIEVTEATAKFTTDVIGSCAFGLNLKSLSSEDSEFRKMGRRIFAPKFSDNLKGIIREFSPTLFKLLKIRLNSPEHTEFFMGSIAETIAYRKKNGIVRHDFIHLMTQLQEKQDGTDFEITDELVAAQAFLFFLAGFETSSTTTSFALYELAQNKNIQDKLRAEIRDALKTHNGQLPYEAVRDLKYLDKVFQETLRKHPPATNVVRMAMKNCTLPDSTVRIPAGTKIFIPILGLHRDPQYYPEPNVFDPERFSEQAIQQRTQMVYLPFGEGPRNCIGARFANYQTKVGIIRIIKNYEVTLPAETKVPYDIEKLKPILSPVGGIHLNFKKMSQI